MNETIELRWVNKITFNNGERVSTPTLQYRELDTHHGIDTMMRCNPYQFQRWSNWREVEVTNIEIY
jgi:hypothetical protein